ncbi:multidrug efflux SMR transporter [Actinocorallia lasiicapitis]
MPWVFLAGAIGSEVAATLALRGLAGGFRPLPLVLVVAGYAVSFTLMALALRTLNVGLVYAIWSGAGTAAVAGVAAALYGEHLNATAIGGMVLIVLGVVVLATSGATGH